MSKWVSEWVSELKIVLAKKNKYLLQFRSVPNFMQSVNQNLKSYSSSHSSQYHPKYYQKLKDQNTFKHSRVQVINLKSVPNSEMPVNEE